MKSTAEKPTQDSTKHSSLTPTLKSKYDADVNLRDLLIAGLMDMYWSEKALTKAISFMVKNVNSRDLATDMEVHLEETLNQVTLLEEIFGLLKEKPTARKCTAMESLINEAELIIKETEQGAVRDAGIIAVAQKIEHYEIASYVSLSNFAKGLGENVVSSILQEILAEEIESEESLSQLAEVNINNEAHLRDEHRNMKQMENNDPVKIRDEEEEEDDLFEEDDLEDIDVDEEDDLNEEDDLEEEDALGEEDDLEEDDGEDKVHTTFSAKENSEF